MVKNYGRQKILTDTEIITAENVISVLDDALKVHSSNSSDINYLYNVFKGRYDILDRVKEVRPEINNKIVENRANEFVTFKTGYLCGEPIQYVGRSGRDNISDGISDLNNKMLLANKAAKDRELAEWMYICGQAYRMTLPNSWYINTEILPKLQNRQTDFVEDEAPFLTYVLDPRYAFVVYYSGLGEPPVMNVKYVKTKDNGIIYSVYTQSQYFEITEPGPDSGEVERKITARSLRPFNYSRLPIVEYPLNNARLGIVEIVLPIMNAINKVQSNRLDGIEQFIQSLLVLYNCDIDEDIAKHIREFGLVKLKTTNGGEKADMKELAAELDQEQTQTLIDYMYQTMLNIIGMPNRNGGTSTSDTGSAVIMRDGWESAEARAKLDEMAFKASETEFLKQVLMILRSTTGTPLTLADIETKFTRRNYENALSKAQILTIMLQQSKIHPRLAFEHCGLFSDPEDAYKQSEAYYRSLTPEQQGINTDTGGVAIA